MSKQLKEIPTSPLLWFPCQKCKLTTRHVITNPDNCNEKATYICMYKCGGNESTIDKAFYSLYYGCAINETDNRLVFTK